MGAMFVCKMSENGATCGGTDEDLGWMEIDNTVDNLCYLGGKLFCERWSGCSGNTE